MHDVCRFMCPTSVDNDPNDIGHIQDNKTPALMHDNETTPQRASFLGPAQMEFGHVVKNPEGLALEHGVLY